MLKPVFLHTDNFFLKNLESELRTKELEKIIKPDALRVCVPDFWMAQNTFGHRS